MSSRFVLSLGMAGLALATVVAPRAEAQTANPVTVCRNGTRMNSNDSHACDGRGGPDLRATAVARRDEAARVQRTRDEAIRAQNNGDDRYGRNGDDRYGRNDDSRYGRNDDDRYGRNGRANGRGSNNGRFGNGPREVYQWQGTVDKEIRIQLHGSRAYVQRVGAGEVRAGRGQMLSGLPQQEGTIRVERLEGRGQVDVIQQPSASNGYTATLRVRDASGGSSNYRLVAYWQPAYSNNGRFGRN